MNTPKEDVLFKEIMFYSSFRKFYNNLYDNCHNLSNIEIKTLISNIILEYNGKLTPLVYENLLFHLSMISYYLKSKITSDSIIEIFQFYENKIDDRVARTLDKLYYYILKDDFTQFKVQYNFLFECIDSEKIKTLFKVIMPRSDLLTY